MSKNTKNRSKPIALITGGASYLGSEISRTLVLRGFNLVLHYQKNFGRVKKLTDELKRLGSEIELVKLDLRRPEQVGGVVRKTIRRFKRLDLVINNASLFEPSPLLKTKPTQWRKNLEINLISPYFLSRAAFPWLKKTNGSIVNLTDIYGETPRLKNYAAYCVSKAGLIAATKILAKELGPQVRVNAVSPGAIYIPGAYSLQKRKELIGRSALSRQGTPKDIADAVCFLAQQPFITGQILNVDGGRFLN